MCNGKMYLRGDRHRCSAVSTTCAGPRLVHQKNRDQDAYLSKFFTESEQSKHFSSDFLRLTAKFHCSRYESRVCIEQEQPIQPHCSFKFCYSAKNLHDLNFCFHLVCEISIGNKGKIRDFLKWKSIWNGEDVPLLIKGETAQKSKILGKLPQIRINLYSYLIMTNHDPEAFVQLLLFYESESKREVTIISLINYQM